jgi:hypothetical protein
MNMKVTKLSHTTSETEKEDKDTYTLQAKNEGSGTTVSITQAVPFEGYTTGGSVEVTIKKNQKTLTETTTEGEPEPEAG